MSKSKSFKNAFLAGLAVTFILGFAGCGQDQTPADEYAISDYFPYTENVKMVYEGQGNEFASYSTYIDYINNDKIQIRTNNGGTESVKVLQNINGTLSQVYLAIEMYYKLDLTGEPSDPSDVLLKEPLTQGTKWTLEDGSQREITGTAVAIETPYSDFDALEVTTTKNGQTTEKQYYALDIGLVKDIQYADSEEISSSLKEMVTGAGYDFAVRLFNFAVTDTDIESTFTDKTVTLKTGESIEEFISTEFQDGGLMSANTGINSIWIEPGSEVANIDFTKQFITEMNAGTTKESGVLMSVTNTVGYYFQVDKVIITLEGEPYSSGHILMKDGEAFNTTFQNQGID